MDTSSHNSMERLLGELSVLLKMLDMEVVSPSTADKMASVRKLMGQVKPTVNGSALYVNSSLYGNGTSFVESLFEGFDCDLHVLSTSPEEQQEQDNKPQESVLTDTPPPLPTTPIPDDYYEEAVPLDPGSSPQYITTATPSSSNSVEDAYYEDADNNYPSTRVNGPPRSTYNDSDALSSSYESYEEDEEGRGQRRRWAAEESTEGPMRDCRICAFLLRKKRFGQWSKQLAVVRDNKLQCYKSIKDTSPYMELPLGLCNVIYVPKEGRRKRHELRFSLPGGEALVLAVQSKEQAQRWLKVLQEVGSQANNSEEVQGSPSPIIQRKLELDKMLLSDRQVSDSDSGPTGDNTSTQGPSQGPSQGPTRDCTDTLTGRGKRGALSELTGSMSRAAGKKINRIISFSKRKPPLPGDPPSFAGLHDNPRCGYLNVLEGQSWKERWCSVRGGNLTLQRAPGDGRPPVSLLPLGGAEVVPGGHGPKHPFSFSVLQGDSKLVALEASCSEELGRWLGLLLAETGSATLPEELHYDYIDVDMLTDVQSAARNSFLWATSSSSASTDSRTYDEVYESVLQQEAVEGRPGGQVRRHASFSSRGSDRTESQATVKRHASSVNQNARYGKTRAEEDAKRYLREKEELERDKEEIKQSLLLLRKERREAKERDKHGTDGNVEQQLVHYDLLCRQKEEERVELELKLTAVKEKLKKSLAGGALGPPTDTKKIPKVQTKPRDKVYGDVCVPVNSACELRKRPPSLSLYTSSRGNVMKKAKEWESKKAT